MFSWLSASTKDDNDDVDDWVSEIPGESPDAAATLQNPTTTTTAILSSKRCRTWKTAFRDTCLKNGTIHASVVQVLEEDAIDASEIPTATSTAFYFRQDGCNQKLVEHFRQVDMQNNNNNNNNNNSQTAANEQQQQGQARKSTVAYVVDKAVAVTKYAVKYVFSTENDILMEQAGIYPNDDDDGGPTASEEQDLDESEALLNMDLAVECLVFLRDVITRHAAQQDEVETRSNKPREVRWLCVDMVPAHLATVYQ